MVFSLFCILVGSPLAPPQINVSNYALNHFLVQSSAKESLRSAKTLYFPYSTFWSAGQWGGGGAIASPAPPPGYATVQGIDIDFHLTCILMGNFGRLFSAFYASYFNQQGGMEQPAAGGDAHFQLFMQAVPFNRLNILYCKMQCLFPIALDAMEKVCFTKSSKIFSLFTNNFFDIRCMCLVRVHI